jgi:hypothetical protein
MKKIILIILIIAIVNLSFAFKLGFHKFITIRVLTVDGFDEESIITAINGASVFDSLIIGELRLF